MFLRKNFRVFEQLDGVVNDIVNFAAAKDAPGLEGIGVADVMKEAGVTVGGFYKHFDSRDELVVEALAAAFLDLDEISMPRLLSVNVGLPRDVTWNGKTVRTAIWKSPVEGRQMVRKLNLVGDAASMAWLSTDASREYSEGKR